jgi:Sulfotransferase family
MHIEQQERWPNFFIVGAPRCGTTSLYSYLKEVPGVYMPRVKEPFYFSPNLVQVWRHPPQGMITDKEQYLGLFKNAKGYIAVGEASPSYLWDPDSPKLIHEAVPHARIIMLLRDPIDRAYSHYLLDMKTWAPARRSSFADHLTRGGISQLEVQFGMYYEQVKRYLEIFETEQVKVIIFEEYIQHLEQTVNEVLSFLGVDYTVAVMRRKEDNAYSVPRSPLSLWVYAFFRWLRARGINTSRIRILVGDSAILVLEKSLLKGTEKPRMEPKAVEFLRQVYYDDVIRLQSLLGRSLPWRTVLGHEKNNKNMKQRFDDFS